MDKKKYHLRIFRHEELDLVLLTISDHGKFIENIENGKNSDLIPRKSKIFQFENSSLHRCWWQLLGTVCLDDRFEILVTDFKYWSSRELN